MVLTFDQINQNEKIKTTNFNDKLVVYNYRFCDGLSEDYVKECKGVIFDRNGNLIVQTIPFIEEMLDVYKDLDNFNDYTIHEAYEGTMIRVFWYEDKWYISTFKKLNAYTSYWGTGSDENPLPSFGELFEKRILEKYSHLEEFYSTLNKDYTYLFILLPNENTRLVSHAREDVLLFGVYNKGVKVNETLETFEMPKKLSFENIEVLKEYVENMDWKEKSGVLLQSENRLIRVYNSKYYHLLQLRDPSFQDVGVRYLLCKDEEKEDLKKLYPNFNFERYESALVSATTHLYDVAVRRKSEYVHVSPIENTVLKFFEGELTLDNMKRAIICQHKMRLQKIIHIHLV